MRPARVVIEILPRVSVLVILIPILLNINVYVSLLARIPLLISRGSLDLASYPMLILVSILSGLIALVFPSPSMFTLTIFFIALADPRLILSLGIHTIIIAFFIVLASDVMRNIYRGSEEALIHITQDPRSSLIGFSTLFTAIIALPLLISLLIASYIFSFKLHTQSPYLAPVASFLNNNPVGSIIMASIMLAIFYILSRYAVEISLLYAIPNPKLAISELSSVANISWIRPSLGFLRGFIVSALITPPIYYMIREILASLGTEVGGSGDLMSSIMLTLFGLLLFALIWALVSRGLFTEEREPSIRGIIYLISIIAVIYILSLILGVSLWGSGSQKSLDTLLAPITQYYRDLWVLAELIIRAIGGAP
ncbi:MAG: hypothetical protein QXE01_04530 [Sulfolobales archaeon]